MLRPPLPAGWYPLSPFSRWVASPPLAEPPCRQDPQMPAVESRRAPPSEPVAFSLPLPSSTPSAPEAVPLCCRSLPLSDGALVAVFFDE